MFFRYVIFLTVQYFFVQVLASECPATNLFESSPHISKRTDLGQGGMGWCCSYAFTDALSIKAGFNVSPVDIGITQARFTGKIEGCYPLKEVLDSIRKSKGLCREEDYLNHESREILMSAINPFVPSMLKYKDNFANQHAIEELETIFALSEKYPQKFNEACLSNTRNLTPFFANIKNLKDIADVIASKASSNFQEFLYDLAQKNCADRKGINFSYEQIPIDSQNRIDEFAQSSLDVPKARLIASLQDGRSPVLSVDDAALFNVDMSFFRRIGAAIAGSHVVNIVGSREIDGKCYFKVRDSNFGDSNCKSKRANSIICSTESNGTYEIESDELLKATRSIVVVK